MKQKRENGEVVVEASIIVTLVVIFISIMFYIGMILYQQSLVSIMANQTASNIAQVYSNTLKDPFTGYVDSDSVYQSITYSNMKTDAYMQVMEQKANTLAFYRLKSSRILTTGNSSVDVEVVKKPNELLKSQIIVTIRDRYELPLVSMFGVDNGVTFTSSGRADCVDILEYLNGVEAVGDPEHSSVAYLPDSDTCLIQFYENKFDGKLVATVPVLKGKSIITSNYYTHSVMPKNPYSDKWDFTGWKLENGNGFTASYEVDRNISVYGSWECTLTFHPEGGSVNPTSKKVALRTTTQLPDPTRDGYKFIGWFTEKNGKGSQYYSNSTVISDNADLYAYWQCIHKYVLEKHTDGNCQTKEYNRYKCSQCGDVVENYGNYGNHNYQWAGSGGYWCFEGYHIYRCTICGSEYHSDAPGIGTEHNFSARCNVAHGVTRGTFQCSAFGYVAGPDKCQTTSMYHSTCEYCGAINEWYNYRQGKWKRTFWCGTHMPRNLPVTGCGYGGSRK